MTTYRTLQGDVVDAIARAQLGSEAFTPDLLDANPGLAALGPVLPAGLVLRLPQVTAQATTPRIRLWGTAS